MPDRAYTNIRVINEIYVSSSSDYFVDVWYTLRGKRRMKRDYWLNGGGLQAISEPYVIQVPRYVLREIERQLLKSFEDRNIRFYEYDRDHNKRWDNLRYHDERYVDGFMERLRRDLGVPSTDFVNAEKVDTLP